MANFNFLSTVDPVIIRLHYGDYTQAGEIHSGGTILLNNEKSQPGTRVTQNG